METISFIKMLTLFCLHKLDGQRTIYAMVHLFNGKKSSQTIQDAHLFKLTEFFGVFPNFTRFDMDRVISELIEKNFLTIIDEQKYGLTAMGEKLVTDFLTSDPFPKHLNGWKFHYLTHVFWGRLSLVVQVISHLSYQESKYLPIQRKKEYHQWLKSYLKETQLNRKELSARLYEELVLCLDSNKEINPSILVMRLTGYEKIGLTAEQTAEMLSMDAYSYQLHFLNILHYMIESIQKKRKNFRLLYLLISDQVTPDPLTDSTRKTLMLLEKGLSVKEIAHFRKLKQSTIEDHVVEIALNNVDFDTSPFLNKELYDLITRAAQNSSSKQLKQIREMVPEANYFQIRLVLAQGR